MAVHYRTQGFVFKKEDRQEANRVFTVFTKDYGKIKIFAKAIRRIASKLRGGIEIFCVSEIEFIQGKHRKTLTDTIFIEKFSNAIMIPEKVEIANSVSDILNNFIKGQEPDRRIWIFIVDFFQKLNGQQSLNRNQYLLYYYFLWNFIAILGHSPEFSKCAICGQTLDPHNLYFSNKEGGIICIHCCKTIKEGVKTTSDIVKILRIILKKDWGLLLKLKIETGSQKNLKQISENYRNYLYSIYS